MHAAEWSLRSELPSRIRVFHPGLAGSIALRRHCSALLHRTHWLLGHRINVVSSTVVLRFDPNHRDDLNRLLDLCFVDPALDVSLEQALAHENSLTAITRSDPFRRSLKGVVFCGSVLVLEGISLLPPVGLSLIATWLSAPLWLEFFQQIKERCMGAASSKQLLPPASVEVALSATLISSGLARESMVEKFLTDVTGAIQSTTENSAGSSQALQDFLHRLGESVTLRSVDDLSTSVGSLLVDAKVGQQYRLHTKDHVYLPSKVLQGELMVLNTLNNGSAIPQLLAIGDVLPFGAQVLEGSAVCEVLTEFSDVPAFQIDDTFLADNEPDEQQKKWMSLYDAIAPPIQLGIGLWALAGGMVERAIGVLGFNPAEDCERSALSSAETALIDMALNQVHLTDVRVLTTLSQVNEIFVSADVLTRLGTFHFEEVIASASSVSEGFLIQLLGSVANHLGADVESVFWGILADQVYEPLSVTDFSAASQNSCVESYSFLMEAREFNINVSQLGDSFKLIFVENQQAIGELTLVWHPDESFELVRHQLENLGVSLSVVGRHVERQDEGDYRLAAVRASRSKGHKIAYLGDVIDDIQAMSNADVAVGLSQDDVGFVSKTVCDLILGGDILWLSRLIALSRRFVETNRVNKNLIVGSSALVSLASVFAALTPLQAVALFNVVPVFAEVNTIRALNSSTSRV